MLNICYWSLLEPTIFLLVLCLSINIFVKYLLLVVAWANFFLVGFMFKPTLLANIYRINSLWSQLRKKKYPIELEERKWLAASFLLGEISAAANWQICKLRLHLHSPSIVSTNYWIDKLCSSTERTQVKESDLLLTDL